MKVKTAGLICMAMCALIAALGAGPASASQFRSEEYPVKFEGGTEPKHEFTLLVTLPSGSKLKVNCARDHLSGSESAASSSLTLTPSYSECELAGLSATVNLHSCQYALHSTTESVPYAGTMDISCQKAGEEIEFTQSTCTISLPVQTGLKIELTNSGRGHSRSIAVGTNATGVKYKASGGCPKKLSGTFEDGTLTATDVVKGSSESGSYPLGVYVASEQKAEPTLFNFESGVVAARGESVLGSHPVFHTHSFNLECSSATLAGSLEGTQTQTQLAATPEFVGCEVAGQKFAQEAHGCLFVLKPNEGAPTGNMALSCPGEPFTLSSGLWCTIHIPSQEFSKSVQYENTGSGSSRGFVWSAELTGLKYEEPSCVGGGGSFSDGSLKAGWQFKGRNVEGSQLGTWIE